MDPFIIKGYNGANWEVHTYAYHNAQVLFPYPGQTIASLPWAFCIPNGSFRWPLHAVYIGYQVTSKRATYGAYPYLGHSFGEWAADREESTDWYLHPDKNEIYTK